MVAVADSAVVEKALLLVVEVIEVREVVSPPVQQAGIVVVVMVGQTAA